MQQIIDFQENLEMEEFNLKCDKANTELGFLNEIKEPYRIVENQQAYETLFFIRKLVKSRIFRRKSKNWHLFLKDPQTVTLFVDLLRFLCDVSFEFNCESVRVARFKPNVETTLDERRISILEFTVDILLEMARNENDLTIKFLQRFMQQNGGLEAIINFFKQQKFQPSESTAAAVTKNRKKLKAKHFDVTVFMSSLIDLLVGLSQLDELDFGKWQSLKIVDTLKEYNVKLHGGAEVTSVKTILDKIEQIEYKLNAKPISELLRALNDLDLVSLKQTPIQTLLYDFQSIHKYLYKRSFNNVRLFLDADFVGFLARFFKFSLLHVSRQFNTLSKSNSLEETICSASEINVNQTAVDVLDSNQSDPLLAPPKKSTPSAPKIHLERSLRLLNAASMMLNRLINKSYEFVYRFIKAKDGAGHLALLGFFNNDHLIRYLNEHHSTVVNYLLMNLNYLSKFIVQGQPLWSHETNYVENLLKFKLVCSLSTYKLVSNKRHFMDQINSIIANQSSDKHIDNLAEKKFNKIDSIIYSDNNLIATLLDDVQAILTNLKVNKEQQIMLIKRKFVINLCLTESVSDESVKEFNLIYDKTTNWYLVNKLINLYRLSLNMKAKALINENGGSTIFKEIFYLGNDCERIFALQIIVQLCFQSERQCKILLLNDKEFMKSLQSTVESTNLLLKKDLKFLCEQIVWLANNSNAIFYVPTTNAYGHQFLVSSQHHHHRPALIESRLTSSSPRLSNASNGSTSTTGSGSTSSVASSSNSGLVLNKHVMISHHKRNHGLCIKMKDKLMNSGFNVWIDSSINEERSFSNMASLAKAIDRSYCVLVCINEFYRQSTNCQLEARYILKANKKITIISLEEYYELLIDSTMNWLHYLVKDRGVLKYNSVNMEKFFVQLNSNLLNYNLSQLKAKSELIKSKPKLYKELITMRHPRVDDWTEQQISIWFMEAKVSPEIRKAFSKCNGAILRQLYKIRCETPEIFYQLLLTETKEKVTLKDIAQFYFNLEELFK